MDVLRKSLTSVVYNNPRLHQVLFNALTINLDRLGQQFFRSRYPSRFGGMWTDRSDFERVLHKKIERNQLSDIEQTWMNSWRKQGYVILRAAIAHDIIDAYIDDVARLMEREPSPLLMTSFDLTEPEHFTPEKLKKYGSVRVVDDYFYASSSRALLFHPKIIRFLEMVFERTPLLTQSLRFDFGSQQPLHQDSAFVRMNSPMRFAGVWIALEDVAPGSGELIYLPGSHTWEGFLFSGLFKHYDEARDGPEQLAQWHQWILDEAKKRGVEAVKFSAKKGDVLFWHAGLAHGGSPITNPGSTRFSLVGHFCAKGVRPLYHYNKPRHRRIFRDGKRCYTTSYYR